MRTFLLQLPPPLFRNIEKRKGLWLGIRLISWRVGGLCKCKRIPLPARFSAGWQSWNHQNTISCFQQCWLSWVYGPTKRIPNLLGTKQALTACRSVFKTLDWNLYQIDQNSGRKSTEFGSCTKSLERAWPLDALKFWWTYQRPRPHHRNQESPQSLALWRNRNSDTLSSHLQLHPTGVMKIRPPFCHKKSPNFDPVLLFLPTPFGTVFTWKYGKYLIWNIFAKILQTFFEGSFRGYFFYHHGIHQPTPPSPYSIPPVRNPRNRLVKRRILNSVFFVFTSFEKYYVLNMIRRKFV